MPWQCAPSLLVSSLPVRARCEPRAKLAKPRSRSWTDCLVSGPWPAPLPPQRSASSLLSAGAGGGRSPSAAWYGLFGSHAAPMDLGPSLAEWAREQPLSILQLDPADRAVLRIAGEPSIRYFGPRLSLASQTPLFP